MREWRQGVRKLLLLLYTASLLTSLGCFLWNASVPVRVHSAPKCYPSKGDEFSLAPVPTLPADSILNTGDAAALDALPGIGTVLSERIITYREEHGAFVYPEDLRNVQGIGAELQTKITDSLDDESTNPLIAPAAETTTVPRATLPPDSILNTGDAAALDCRSGLSHTGRNTARSCIWRSCGMSRASGKSGCRQFSMRWRAKVRRKATDGYRNRPHQHQTTSSGR